MKNILKYAASTRNTICTPADCAKLLSEIDAASASGLGVNPDLKAAIDHAASEAKNKAQFKKLVKTYTGMTNAGIGKHQYTQKILNSFNN